MGNAASIGLDDLESRLRAKAPRAYREFVSGKSAQSLSTQGFDPKTLLVLNLELQNLEHYNDHRQRFFLNGDGCGNYFFVDLEGDQDKVLLWSHDPPGIEDPDHRLKPYLHNEQQECRIDSPIEPGDLYICRTAVYAESILDPIDLEEWIAAVNSTEGLKYLGYRQGTNPFTGETIRAESPGLTAVLAQKRQFIHFHHGRAMLKDSALVRPLAVSLTQKLSAHLLESK